MYFIPRRILLGSCVSLSLASKPGPTSPPGPPSTASPPVQSQPPIKLCKDCKYFINQDDNPQNGLCKKYIEVDLVDGSTVISKAKIIRYNVCKGTGWEQNENYSSII